MIKTYDTQLKAAFLAHLELLMIKSISYSWTSVRAFHKFVAKQVEQRRLEWQDSKAINDQAATFFRHSDLRSPASHIEVPHQASTTNSRSSSSTTSPTQPAFKPSTGPKACKAWNYTGACDCDKQDSAICSEHHRCRVCKADHPMLHCPKRCTPILAQWLSALPDSNTFSSSSQNGQGHDSFNISAVVRYLLASRHAQPNAFGAKVIVLRFYSRTGEHCFPIITITLWLIFLHMVGRSTTLPPLVLSHHLIIICQLWTLTLMCKPISTPSCPTMPSLVRFTILLLAMTLCALHFKPSLNEVLRLVEWLWILVFRKDLL